MERHTEAHSKELTQPVSPSVLPLPRGYDPPITSLFWQEWRERLPGKTTSPLIVLHGGYGKRNLGDDAILHVLLAQIREAIPGAQIIVLCHGPKIVQREEGVEAHHFASYGALRAILSADLYVIGGGGIINRINVYSGWRRWRVFDPKGKFLFLAALLAKVRRAKVIFQAIGATSVPDPVVGWLARAAMNRADEVSVRDSLSCEVLQKLGIRQQIRVVPDPAVLLEAATSSVAQAILRREGLDPDERLIGLNLRPVAEPDISNVETARIMAHVVDWMIENYCAQVCFLPFSRHPSKAVENDVSLALEVKALIQSQDCFHILLHPCTSSEMKAILGEMDFCLLERLHAAILAASMGVPFVAISYEDKVSQFAQAIGFGNRVIALHALDFETARTLIERLVPWK